MRKNIALLVIALSTCISSFATRYLVQQSTGSTWRTAGNGEQNVTLAGALNTWYNATVASGDEVWLINGTYTLSDSIQTKGTEKIYGGFAGNETNWTARTKNSSDYWDFANVTIIDGNNNALNRCITVRPGGLVDGVTIQRFKFLNGGEANAAPVKITGSGVLRRCIIGSCSSTTGSAGGGVNIFNTGRLVQSNIKSCSNTGTGGGVIMRGGIIDSCKFNNNSSTGSAGGAVYLTSAAGTVSNSSFLSNTSSGQGGAAIANYGASGTTIITNCTFTSNTSNSTGGALQFYNTASLSGCTFTNNSTSGAEGGVVWTTATTTFQNCIFQGNSCTNYTKNGSAVYVAGGTTTMNNCVITNNTGGASVIGVSGTNVLVVQNSTIANNTTIGTTQSSINLGTGSASNSFKNCLFLACFSTPFFYTTTAPTVQNCGFDGQVSLAAAPYNGTGNINTITSGTFVNTTPSMLDYHLVGGAPAINVGTATALSGCSTDLDGISRPIGASCDMGAYESFAAPVATSATNTTTTGFTANWSAVTGAATYRLDVATDNAFTSLVSGYNNLTVSSTSQAVVGLTIGTSYYYRVRAFNGNSGTNSNTICAITSADNGVPTANDATSITGTGLIANWGTVDGATGYELDVATDVTFSSFVSGYNALAVSGQSTTSQVITGLTAGTAYYYRLRAIGTASGANSNTIATTTTPTASTANAATNLSSVGFTANWSAVNGASSGYLLDVATDAGFTLFVTGYNAKAITGQATISQQIAGLSSLTTYYYRVRATNGTPSGYSNTITVQTLLPAPTANVATSISSTGFTANWSTISGASSGYILDVATDAAFTSFVSGYNAKAIAGQATTSQVLTSLTAGTNYYYRIRATNGIVGDNSNTITILTATGAPTVAAATNVTNTSFTANWSTVTGASSGYILDVATDAAFTSFATGYNAKAISGQSTASQAVTGLTAGTPYYYRLRATNGTVSTNSATSYVITLPTLGNYYKIRFKNGSWLVSDKGTGAKLLTTATANTDDVLWLLSDATNGFYNLTSKLGNKMVYDSITTSRFISNSTGSGTGIKMKFTGTNNATYSPAIEIHRTTSLKGMNMNAGAGNGKELAEYSVNDSGNALELITVDAVATIANNLTSTSFSANWGTVSGATKYYLDVATDVNFTSFLSGYNNKDVGNVITYSITGLTANTTYYYRVRTYCGATGNNSNTITAITLPGTPTSTAASSITTSGFTANWTAPTQGNATFTYSLDYSTLSSFASNVTSLTGITSSNLNQVITSLTPSAYYYRVRTVNASGFSAWSATQTVIMFPAVSSSATKYYYYTLNFCRQSSKVIQDNGIGVNLSQVARPGTILASQEWRLEQVSSGVYNLVSKTGGKFLSGSYCSSSATASNLNINLTTNATYSGNYQLVRVGSTAYNVNDFAGTSLGEYWDIPDGGNPIVFTLVETITPDALILGVESAEATYAISSSGVNPGQYTIAAASTFQAAITAAKAVRDNAASTQPQRDAAATTLETARTTFLATTTNSIKTSALNGASDTWYYITSAVPAPDSRNGKVMVDDNTGNNKAHFATKVVNTNMQWRFVLGTNVSSKVMIQNRGTGKWFDVTPDMSATAGEYNSVLLGSAQFKFYCDGRNPLHAQDYLSEIVNWDAGLNSPSAWTLEEVPLTAQTITFGTLTAKTIGDGTFNLSATASSSLAVSYVSSNTNVATVSGSTVTVIGVGTTNITAIQVGNATIARAPDVVQSLTVNSIVAPVSNSASDVAQTSFTANWSASVNATSGYLLDVATDNAFTNLVSGYNGLAVATTSKSVSGLSGNTTYYYRVRAKNGSLEGANSSIITVLTVPANPTVSAASDITATYFTANWVAGAGDGSLSYYIDVATDNTFTSFVSGYNNTLANASTSKSIMNLSPNTTYYYRVRASNASGTSGSTSYAIAATNSSIIVSSNTLVTDLPNCPTCNVSVTAGVELTVGTNKTFNTITVAPTGKLTINNQSILTASVVLRSDATGNATLIDNNATPLTLTGTVEQYLPQGRNWYVSSPVTSGAATVLTTGAASTVSYYDESTSAWVDNSTGILTPGVGYVAASNTGTATNSVQFTGTLTTGNVTVNLSNKASVKAGFNLIANPYASYLNVMDAINANSNIMSTIWYRTCSTGGSPVYYFETVNTVSGIGTNDAGTGTITGWLPPMQAIWVRTNVDGEQLVFTNAMRHHAGNVTTTLGDVPTTRLKVSQSTKTDATTLLRLQVANGFTTNEAILYTNPNALNDLDVYDSPKMWNGASVAELFTVAGGESLVLNGMKTLPLDTEIPLGIKTEASNSLSIVATELSNLASGIQVILKDNQGITNFDLTNGAVYNFASEAVTTTDRFSLILKSPSFSTGLITANPLQVGIYSNVYNQLVLRFNDVASNNAILTVYNAVGQKTIERSISTLTNYTTESLIPGVYVVCVNVNGEKITKKVVVKH